jgi:hypothetical protein
MFARRLSKQLHIALSHLPNSQHLLRPEVAVDAVRYLCLVLRLLGCVVVVVVVVVVALPVPVEVRDCCICLVSSGTCD